MFDNWALTGDCRRNKLRQMSTNDIQDKRKVLVITIPKKKADEKRVFTISYEIIEIIVDL